MDKTAEITRRVGEASEHGPVKPFRQRELERYLLEAGSHARCKTLLRNAVERGSALPDPMHMFFMEGASVRIATFPAAAFHEIEHGVNEMRGRGECWEALGSVVGCLESDWTVVEYCVHDVADRVRSRARNRRRRSARRAARAMMVERLHQSLRDSIARIRSESSMPTTAGIAIP